MLVFEDLHWADDGLLDFIDHLVDWAGGVPILVVCTARPELLARRAGWGGGKPNAATLSLSPLDDDQTARLLAALLERSVLPAETQTALLQRAGGNPLYAEEFVRMVADRELVAGDEDLPLPESVQGIVAARLDALPDEEKTLLQDAAVIGKVFWLGAAAGIGGLERAAAEESLHSLERKEFVRRERRPSVAGESEYAFRHLLVRDVAYSQIPRARRAEKHRLAGEWIERLGRPDDHAEMLAHHYSTLWSSPEPPEPTRPRSRNRQGVRCMKPATAHTPWARTRRRGGSTPRQSRCGPRTSRRAQSFSFVTDASSTASRSAARPRSSPRRSTPRSRPATPGKRPRRRRCSARCTGCSAAETARSSI